MRSETAVVRGSLWETGLSSPRRLGLESSDCGCYSLSLFVPFLGN